MATIKIPQHELEELNRLFDEFSRLAWRLEITPKHFGKLVKPYVAEATGKLKVIVELGALPNDLNPIIDDEGEVVAPAGNVIEFPGAGL